MRAQLVRILDSQGVPIPAPHIGSVHSIRVTLGFVDIAFDECRPKRMAGYGELADTAAPRLPGSSMRCRASFPGWIRTWRRASPPTWRSGCERLQEAGGDVALVQTLERAINQHGLVEFRPALATIIDRLETRYVSRSRSLAGSVRGKSSLLNHIVGQDLLPVGVNPVTAVPTRLAYGSEPRATAWFADRKPEQFGIERLAEFVTEQHNPGKRPARDPNCRGTAGADGCEKASSMWTRRGWGRWPLPAPPKPGPIFRGAIWASC